MAVNALFQKTGLVLIAGPCVIESKDLCLEVAERARDLAAARGVGFIFKSSYDKANRTSVDAFRGPGLKAGLEVLAAVKDRLGIPVLTDIHEPNHAYAAAEVVDILQIPAFLCRQTDLVAAAARTGKPTNIKKGQFLSPLDVRHLVEKHRASGGGPVAITERGTTFGYGDLVVDMRGIAVMRQTTDAAVIFDATHSVQQPGTGAGVTGGDRAMAPILARAAAAVGIDGLFCEVHTNPAEAKSDAANALTFELLSHMLDEVCAIDAVRRGFGEG